MTVPGRLYAAAAMVAVATVPVALFLSRPRLDSSGCPPASPCDPYVVDRDWGGFAITCVIGLGLAVVLILIGLFLHRRAMSRAGGGAGGR